MRIAVVVAAFNVAPYVGDAIGSVVAQTCRDWTLTIVDDGSIDGTAEIAGRFADPRIRVLRQRNVGVAAARNRGLAEGSGEAVLFLDADDWLAANALDRLSAALACAPDAIAAVSRFAFVPESANPAVRLPVRALPPRSGFLLPALLERNLFANGGHLLIRRRALEQVGGFRPGLAYGEDWELWCRLAGLGPFVADCNIKPALFVRQRHGGAMLRMANDPGSFRPCVDAIFENSTLPERLGAGSLNEIRRRTEAENAWIVGRELVRHGRRRLGRTWLRESVAAKPSLRRAVLLAAAHALPVLPRKIRGPFRPYEI